ncbi:MAG: phosphotransferase [Pseudomonadota bacterium]
MTTRLQHALADWSSWPLSLTEPPGVVAVLDAGRTNLNYRLRAPGLGDDLVLRLHRLDSARLGVDRQREQRIVRLTAEAGLGRPCWYWNEAADYSLHPYIDARAWQAGDFSRRMQRRRLWPLIEQLASIEFADQRRSYGDYLSRYWAELESSGAMNRKLQDEWRAFLPDLELFDRGNWPAVLTHHDLVPANVLDTGDRLILIDWEYAALGHPDIDCWAIDPRIVSDPFVIELVKWTHRLWELLATGP